MTLTREQKCRTIVEACGGHWHESFGKTCLFRDFTGEYYEKEICHVCNNPMDCYSNPDFRNVSDLLKWIEKRKDFRDFIMYTHCLCGDSYGDNYLIHLSYITEPDKLLNAAYEWVREGE